MDTLSKPAKNQVLAAWIFGSLLLLFMLWVFVFAPDDIPAFKQQLLKHLAAVLAGLFGFFLTGSVALQAKSTRSRLGQVAVKASGGAALFVFVWVMWPDPPAPAEGERAGPGEPVAVEPRVDSERPSSPTASRGEPDANAVDEGTPALPSAAPSTGQPPHPVGEESDIAADAQNTGAAAERPVTWPPQEAKTLILGVSTYFPPSQPIAGVPIGILEYGLMEMTDEHGRASLSLPAEIQPGEVATLQLGNQDLNSARRWVLVSPKDRFRFPRFDTRTDNVMLVFLARWGDLRSVMIRHQVELSLNLRQPPREQEKQAALQSVAADLGLSSEDVHDALEAYATSAEHAFDRGLANLYTENFTQAEVDFRTALSMRPLNTSTIDSVNIVRFLGQALLLERKYGEAVEFHREALAMSPRDTALMMNLGIALGIAGQLAESGDILRQVYEINYRQLGPDHPRTQLAFANLTKPESTMVVHEPQRRNEPAILLRIYFAGMIAFVPGGTGRDMTVLLPDLRDGYIASDGMPIEPHTAFLVARAGGCEGDCTADQEPIAEMLYRGLSDGHGEPMELLRKAVREGGVWELADSDLVIDGQPLRQSSLRILWNDNKPQGLVPESSEEERSFDWVPDIGQIVPGAGEIDPGVLSGRPRRGLLVARLRLSEGEVRTHRMIRVGDDVPAIDFLTLHDDQVFFSQALAHWIVAEVPVRVQEGDCKVRLVDWNLVDGSRRRVMELMPERCEEGGVIDVAILNVPSSSFKPVTRPPTARNRIGRHFEAYYELSSHPPASRLRPVPHVGNPGVPWKVLHSKADESSDFLESIVLAPGKGVANPLLSPPAQFSIPDSGAD